MAIGANSTRTAAPSVGASGVAGECNTGCTNRIGRRGTHRTPIRPRSTDSAHCFGDSPRQTVVSPSGAGAGDARRGVGAVAACRARLADDVGGGDA